MFKLSPYWFVYIPDLSITQRDMLRTPNIIMVLTIFLISLINFCYIYFEAPLLGANTFSTDMSSEWTGLLSIWSNLN